MRFLYSRHFCLRKEAENAIVEMGKTEKKNYFDGTFVHLYDRCYVYAFTTTLRASDATLHDFKVPLVQCHTDSILPTTLSVIVEIKVDLCVVANEDLIKVREDLIKVQEDLIKVQDVANEQHQMLVRLSSTCDAKVLLSETKKLKLEVDSKVEHLNPVNMSKLVMIKPDENDRTRHIVKQLTTFTQQNGLHLYTNQSNICTYGNCRFSKYATSQPDITVYDPIQFTVVTPDNKMVCQDEEDGEGVGGDGVGDGKPFVSIQTTHPHWLLY